MGNRHSTCDFAWKKLHTQNTVPIFQLGRATCDANKKVQMRRKTPLIKLPRPVFTLVGTSVLLCCPVAPSEEQTEEGPPLACLACSFWTFFSPFTFHSLLRGLLKSFRYVSDKLQSSFLPVILSTVGSYPPSVGQMKEGRDGCIWLH